MPLMMLPLDKRDAAREAGGHRQDLREDQQDESAEDRDS